MHAEIHLGQHGGLNRVVIDGHDITKHVLIEGFAIKAGGISESPDGPPVIIKPVIQMIIRPDTIDVTGDFATEIQLAKTRDADWLKEEEG